jgi:excisionase family DNA binding protein
MELLTVQETAKLLSVSRSTVYNLMKQQNFPRPIRIGSKILFERAKMIEYLLYKRREQKKPPFLFSDVKIPEVPGSYVAQLISELQKKVQEASPEERQLHFDSERVTEMTQNALGIAMTLPCLLGDSEENNP